MFAGAAARYPANSFEIGDGFNTAGFRFNADNRIKNNSHVFRLDFNFSDKQQGFLPCKLYTAIRKRRRSSFQTRLFLTAWHHPFGFVIGHNWMITNDLINNFRYGLTRDSSTELGDSSDNAIGFSGVYFPRIFRRSLSSRHAGPKHNR